MKVLVKHSLGLMGALSRVQDAISRLQSEHADKIEAGSVKETWTQPTQMDFEFKPEVPGFNPLIKGTMEVGIDFVSVEGDLPFAARLYEGRIEKEIRDHLEKELQP